VLDSQARELVLIRVVSFSNRSPDQIRVRIPARLTGKATQERFHHKNALSRFYGSTPDCRYEPTVQVSVNDLGSAFFIIPESATLADTWPAVIKERPSDSHEIDIDPNGRVNVGIYTEGPNALLLAEKQLDRGAAREVEVPIACTYECFTPIGISSQYLNQCNRYSELDSAKKAACQSRVDACAPFLREFSNARTTHPTLGMPWSNSQKVQECGPTRYVQSDLEGSWRPGYVSECLDSWQQTVIHKRRVIEGIQNAPAFLTLSEESTRVELSYTDDEPLAAAKISREKQWGPTKIQQTQ
jgi:hypothetical protein